MQSLYKDKLRSSSKMKKTLEALQELGIEGTLNRINNYIYRISKSLQGFVEKDSALILDQFNNIKSQLSILGPTIKYDQYLLKHFNLMQGRLWAAERELHEAVDFGKTIPVMLRERYYGTPEKAVLSKEEIGKYLKAQKKTHTKEEVDYTETYRIKSYFIGLYQSVSSSLYYSVDSLVKLLFAVSSYPYAKNVLTESFVEPRSFKKEFRLLNHRIRVAKGADIKPECENCPIVNTCKPTRGFTRLWKLYMCMSNLRSIADLVGGFVDDLTNISKSVESMIPQIQGLVQNVKNTMSKTLLLNFSKSEE